MTQYKCECPACSHYHNNRPQNHSFSGSVRPSKPTQLFINRTQLTLGFATLYSTVHFWVVSFARIITNDLSHCHHKPFFAGLFHPCWSSGCEGLHIIFWIFRKGLKTPHSSSKTDQDNSTDLDCCLIMFDNLLFRPLAGFAEWPHGWPLKFWKDLKMSSSSCETDWVYLLDPLSLNFLSRKTV